MDRREHRELDRRRAGAIGQRQWHRGAHRRGEQRRRTRGTGDYRRAELHGDTVGATGPATAGADTRAAAYPSPTRADTYADANAGTTNTNTNTNTNTDANADANANANAAAANTDADADTYAAAYAYAAAGPSARRLLGEGVGIVRSLSDGHFQRRRQEHLNRPLDRIRQARQVRRLEERKLSRR